MLQHSGVKSISVGCPVWPVSPRPSPHCPLELKAAFQCQAVEGGEWALEAGAHCGEGVTDRCALQGVCPLSVRGGAFVPAVWTLTSPPYTYSCCHCSTWEGSLAALEFNKYNISNTDLVPFVVAQL